MTQRDSFGIQMIRNIGCIAILPFVQSKLVTKHGLRSSNGHPFLQQTETEVDAIHYPDIGAFSVKLSKTSSDYNKNSGRIIKDHELDPELVYKPGASVRSVTEGLG
jgi:hypothetical protein